MKFKLTIILLFLFLSVTVAQARSLDELSFRMVDKNEIGNYCPSGKNALGCFNPNDQSITLRTNLIIFRFVLTHEIGHFLMQDITYKEYREVFGEGTLHELMEKAANAFANFVWLPFTLEEKVKEFFQAL